MRERLNDVRAIRMKGRRRLSRVAVDDLARVREHNVSLRYLGQLRERDGGSRRTKSVGSAGNLAATPDRVQAVDRLLSTAREKATGNREVGQFESGALKGPS
jgi:hypothetical protein